MLLIFNACYDCNRLDEDIAFKNDIEVIALNHLLDVRRGRAVAETLTSVQAGGVSVSLAIIRSTADRTAFILRPLICVC